MSYTLKIIYNRNRRFLRATLKKIARQEEIVPV